MKMLTDSCDASFSFGLKKRSRETEGQCKRLDAYSVSCGHRDLDWFLARCAQREALSCAVCILKTSWSKSPLHLL